MFVIILAGYEPRQALRGSEVESPDSCSAGEGLKALFQRPSEAPNRLRGEVPYTLKKGEAG